MSKYKVTKKDRKTIADIAKGLPEVQEPKINKIVVTGEDIINKTATHTNPKTMKKEQLVKLTDENGEEIKMDAKASYSVVNGFYMTVNHKRKMRKLLENNGGNFEGIITYCAPYMNDEIKTILGIENVKKD